MQPYSPDLPSPHRNPSRPIADSIFSRPTRLHAWILAALLLWTTIGLAAQLHLVLRDTLVHSVDLLFDDAYYYLGVAWNLAHRHDSMFTGPLSTNGYHPLWLLLLAGLTAVFDLSRQGLFVAALVLTAAVKCAGLYLFDFGQPDAWRRTLGRIALFIAIVKYPLVFSMGMETTLFIVFIPWLLRSAKNADTSAWRGTRLGLLMSLVFLSRLDALALDLAVLGLAFFTRRLTLRQVVAALLPLVATLAIYTAINFHFFGTALPVSGQAKAIGSHFAANLGTSLDYLASLRWVGVMLVVWAVARFTVAPKLQAGAFELISLAIATAACALYYGAMSGWPIWPWYLYPNAYLTVYATIAGGLGVMALFDAGRTALQSRPAAVRAWRIGGAALAVLVAVPYLARVVANETLVNDHLSSAFLHRDTRVESRSSFNQQNVALIPWLTANYPAGATVVMGDRAGGLGYWMPDHFRLLQIEGLVADKAFLSVLKSGALTSYLDAQHADLYISDRPRTFEHQGVFGFIEPVQAKVTGGALNILCFRESEQLMSQDYSWGSDPQQRRIFDARRRVDCPAELLTEVRALQGKYDGLRGYAGF